MNQATMFPEATPDDVRLHDKIQEIERELELRRKVYPRWVQAGKISQEQAHRQIIVLEAIYNDYIRAAARGGGTSA